MAAPNAWPQRGGRVLIQGLHALASALRRLVAIAVVLNDARFAAI